MQLPDEAISYEYQGLLMPALEEWTPAAELRTRHFLSPARLKNLAGQMINVRSQVATERELQAAPGEPPVEAGFIDLPQKTLDNHRRRGEASELGRVLHIAGFLKEQVDRVIILAAGGAYNAGRALFEGLCPAYHNELPPKARLGIPRIYFEGHNLDSDSLQDLLDLLESTCVDSELRDERWGLIVINHGDDPLETAATFRVLHKEATKFYGARAHDLRHLIVPITSTCSRLHDLCQAEGYSDDDILILPERVGSRFSVFTPAGLLPAAVMGLDVRALLLGAAAMTRRFLEEPFERNPVLQYAAVNYLMTEETGKPQRVLAVWSKKLEALARWYDQMVAECLGKQGRGPTPLSIVQTRDQFGSGQLHQEGPRDKVINNLVLKQPRTPPLVMGMADNNEDELNVLNRKSFPDLMEASLRGSNQALYHAARPTADLVLPTLSEHTMGQLLQMLMLATVVEGKLMGVNPYGQPGLEPYWRYRQELLRQ